MDNYGENERRRRNLEPTARSAACIEKSFNEKIDKTLQRGWGMNVHYVHENAVVGRNQKEREALIDCPRPCNWAKTRY